jgi:hypothetical protein
MGMQVSLWCAGFIAFIYIPGSGVTGTYGSSPFIFFKETPTVFPY